jgi:hypothetical protein
MNTHMIAAGLAGFLLGGLTVSVAAQLEDDGAAHGAPATHVVLTRR